jgi:RNA polymerase sigma-70 factor, ECF subfamily
VAVSADARLGQGDPTGNGTAALATELFQQHSTLVLAICRRLLADPAEAEDAMQQTFLHAYRSLLAGGEPRQPAAWLASIARNECLNRIRARTREPVADELSNGATGSPDALNAAIASEDLRALGHTIKRLPAHQREALLLHEFCGLRYDEVAAAIGVSESAIGSLLFRARSRLRFLLQRAYGLLPVPWLWDLTRTPGVKIAALPAVAKMGTAAVAVSLATGSVVVIEHEAEGPKKPAAPPVQASAAPARSTALRTTRPIEATVAEKRPARPSSATTVPATTRTHIRKAAKARKVHKVHPTRPTAAVAAENATAELASYVPAAPPGQAKKESSPTSARSRSAHTSTGSAKSKPQHANGRPSVKVTPPGQADKRAPAKSTVQGAPNGNAWGNDKSPNAKASGADDAQPQGNGSANSASNADHASTEAGGVGKSQSSHPKN